MAEEPWSWARRMAQGVVYGGIELGWSGTEIISFLREVGWGYRTQDVYADIRSFTGRTKWEYQITRLDPTSVIPRSWMTETSKEIWKLDFPTKAVGYVNVYNTVSGEYEEKYATIGLPREMTLEEILEYVREEVPWSAYEEPLVVMDWQTIGMMHLEGGSY